MKPFQQKEKDFDTIVKILQVNCKTMWEKNYRSAFFHAILKTQILHALRKLPEPICKDIKFLKAWLQLNFPEDAHYHNDYIESHLYG